MPHSRFIETEEQRKLFLRFAENHKLPFTVEVSDGRHRSTAANRLQRQWMNDIAAQLGDTPETWRGYCKLHIGVPIRKESAAWAEAYDKDIRPLPYELKLRLMMAPLDFPVTRDMTSKQMAQYLDTIQRDFLARGVALTDPEALKYAEA